MNIDYEEMLLQITDVLKAHNRYHMKTPDHEQAVKLIRDIVTPKGKWIHCEQVNGLGGYWKCSCCGEPAIFTPRLDIDNTQLYSWDNSKTNYCPNCGARMDIRGGEEDDTEQIER